MARLARRLVFGRGPRRVPEGPAISPRAYAESAGDPRYYHRTLRPRIVQPAPLPGNVGRRDELSRERRPWGFSFHDVPDRQAEARSVARMPECRILPFRDRWGSEFHAVVTPAGRPVRLHGTRFPAEVEPIGQDPPVDCGEAAWIMGRWHRNYYHWLLYHLPKLLVLQDLGAERSVLVPGPGPLRPVIEASLEALGIAASDLRSAPATAVRADPLWVVEADRFDSDLLRRLRERIVGRGESASRRVHLSRERTRRRRLVNARDVQGALAATGFETVAAEELTFPEQVALASRTRILVGVHGAALTNMIFMLEGAHVVELANPRYPSPAFYALASALGLRYWLIWGRPRDDRGAGSLDVEIDPRELARVIATIERET